jgi:protein O-mannosyl-transferase
LADKNKNKEVKKSNTLLAWICVAVITLITYFVFSPSLDNGFTNWDDNFYVQGNPLVVGNSINLEKILLTPVNLNYHPLTMLSLALNYQSGKLDPSGYHLENLIFHLLNTILVFLFIFLLTRRNLLMAAIVSLFFGIHPMHVESVAWISERKDVLYVFFFVAGLITYLRYSESKKISWYIFTLLLFILSCLSKGMAVVFPVILLLIDYLKGIEWKPRLFIEKIPFFLISLAFGIIAVMLQSGKAVSGMKSFTVVQRLMFVCYGAVMYIIRLFVPFKLSAFYPYPHDSSGITPIFYLSPVILFGVLAALVYFYLKKEKEIVFGLLFYFVSVVLVLQFISIGRVIIADRYTYLSYIGLLFIVAHLINKAWQSKSGTWASMKYPVVILAIIVAVAFSSQTYSRTQVWNNSATLWSDVIDNYPDVSLAWFSRANYYYDNHEQAKALNDYNKALTAYPTDANSYEDAYFNRGELYSKFYKRKDLAIADFTKAIALDDTFSLAYFNRALLYNDYGKTDSAIADFTKAIASNPTFADAYNDRGTLYFDVNKFDLSIAGYTKAIALNPASADYYHNRALGYDAINQYKNELNDYTRAIQLSPQNALYYDYRGLCNLKLNNYNEAIADFSNAINIAPSVADYWFNRSVAETKAGQNEKAQADAVKGRQLRK